MTTLVVPEEIRRQAAAAVSDVVEVLEADGGSVWLHDGEGYYRPVVLEGLAASFASQMDKVPYLSTQTGRPVLADHNPLVVNTEQGPAFGISDATSTAARDSAIATYWVNRIQVDGRIIGNLSVVFSKPTQTTAWKLACLDALSTQLGVALESESELEEAKAIERGLLAYSEMAKAMMSYESTDQVLGTLSVRAQELVGATNAAVMLLDETGALEPYNPLSAPLGDPRIARIEPGEPAAAFEAISAKRTVVIENVADSTAPVSRRLAQRSGVHALVAVPLIGFGRALGALVIVDQTPRAFSAEDIRLMETTGQQAALALHRLQVSEELTQRQRDLRLLSDGLVDAHEQQRLRIARGLEESVGSKLEELEEQVFDLRRRLNENEGEAALELCSRARALVQDLTQVARSLSSELHPGILEDLGLVAALRWYCAQVSESSGIEVLLETPRRADPGPKAARTLYRVVQESLANVVLHSGATRATVRLTVCDAQYGVEIEDDGEGFDLSALSERGRLGLGLLGMRERARHLGGRLDVESAPGKGTRVRLELDTASL